MANVISPDAARGLAEAVLTASGTLPANAAAVARALVAADLDGIASHGLSRLPAYADQARVGKVDGQAVPVVAMRAGAAARVDARCGFAFPAIDLALATVLELAPQAGIAAVAIGNSHHCGVAGHHVERLAERGVIGLLLANTPAAMAPWGGTRATFGTNPIAFAAPRHSAPPLVVDLSLSKVARGRVVVARQRGEPIPSDWALDADGRPTTDPVAALAGTMVPMADAKGAALALMVEILAATLTGSAHASEASSFLDADGGPPRVGQLIVAIDPAAFGATGFAARIEALIGEIVSQPGTRLPGARRLEERRRRTAAGLEIDDALLREIERRL